MKNMNINEEYASVHSKCRRLIRGSVGYSDHRDGYCVQGRKMLVVM